jgi:hypothetical protein
MSLRCIRDILPLVCLVVPAFCVAQVGSFREEYAFLKHLAHERLYEERLFVLENISDSVRSTHHYIEKAWTLHALGRYDSSLRTYNFVPSDSLLAGNFRNDYFDLLFKTNSLKELRQQLNNSSVEDDSAKHRYVVSLGLMQRQYDLKSIGNLQLDHAIENSYRNYFKASKKSPALAGLYSAAIPGAGKLYAGKKRQALNMFILNAALGLQAWESYHKAGVNSARFIVFGGLFSVMYISNIYGSIKSVIKSRRDEQKQLHYEILHRYLAATPVYPGQ